MTVRVTIDDQIVEAHEGMTVLEAARAAGIVIPTLCLTEGVAPRTSCFLCVVQVVGREEMQPSCALPVAAGMKIITNSPEISATRRTALELLLSDHAGRCVAPCAMGCPAHLDIPGFIRPLIEGDLKKSIAVIKDSLPLPAVLGMTCAAYCENACVRKREDESVMIRRLHRVVAEFDLASDNPYLPEKADDTGKRIAILGTDAAGLCAAWFLLQAGHACVFFDSHSEAGGLLRQNDDGVIEKNILDAEIAQIEKLGAEMHLDWQLGRDGTLAQLREKYDAILFAQDAQCADAGALQPPEGNLPGGLFAVGPMLADQSNVVRAVATAQKLSSDIDQYLKEGEISPPSKPFYFVSRNQTEAEKTALFGNPPRFQSAEIHQSLKTEQREAERCLQCSCVARDDCKLRDLSNEYSARQARFQGDRRECKPDHSHPDVVYDSGKCILCGLCIEVAAQAGEEHGLSFIGRGFPTRVSPPLAVGLPTALGTCARQCAKVCPTGALTEK